MDKLALLGFFGALAAIAAGFMIEGGALSALIHFPAFLIVFGGTLGAVMLQTPFAQFRQGIVMLSWVFFSQKLPMKETAERLVRWSTAARTYGFLALEDDALREQDPFLQRGLNLVVDGVEPPVLLDTLSAELSLERERLLRSAKIFDAMGGYSPTIGIIGAVLGLILAMSAISEPEKLGEGIATAFVATIYGVGFANLVFIPVGNKLKNLVLQRALYYELVTEGLLSIASGENPRNIERKLAAYLPG